MTSFQVFQVDAMTVFQVALQPDLVAFPFWSSAVPQVMSQHFEVRAFQLTSPPVVLVSEGHGFVASNEWVDLLRVNPLDDLRFLVPDPGAHLTVWGVALGCVSAGLVGWLVARSGQVLDDCILSQYLVQKGRYPWRGRKLAILHLGIRLDNRLIVSVYDWPAARLPEERQKCL